MKTIAASNRDVVKATHVIANELKMKNDFPVFMAVMDLAWFRPDLIDPASKVPTGTVSQIKTYPSSITAELFVPDVQVQG